MEKTVEIQIFRREIARRHVKDEQMLTYNNTKHFYVWINQYFWPLSVFTDYEIDLNFETFFSIYFVFSSASLEKILLACKLLPMQQALTLHSIKTV